jgi:hypothetical protein
MATWVDVINRVAARVGVQAEGARVGDAAEDGVGLGEAARGGVVGAGSEVAVVVAFDVSLAAVVAERFCCGGGGEGVGDVAAGVVGVVAGVCSGARHEGDRTPSKAPTTRSNPRIRIGRGYVRLFQTEPQAILLALGIAAPNILILRAWHAKRRLQDPWVLALNEPKHRYPGYREHDLDEREPDIVVLDRPPPGQSTKNTTA